MVRTSTDGDPVPIQRDIFDEIELGLFRAQARAVAQASIRRKYDLYSFHRSPSPAPRDRHRQVEGSSLLSQKSLLQCGGLWHLQEDKTMRSSWIGISLLDPGSVTRAAHSSRWTAAYAAVLTSSRSIRNGLFNGTENPQVREGRWNLSGRSTREVTL